MLLLKKMWKSIVFKLSHIGHLKAERLLSYPGKYWPGRLHPSVQIHHNPIKPADFAIICRFPQSGSSKQIQLTLHKWVVASQSAPQPDRATQKPGEDMDGTVWSQDGHTLLLSFRGAAKGWSPAPKASDPQLSSQPRQGMVKHYCLLHDPLHHFTTMSQSRFKGFRSLPALTTHSHVHFKQSL